MLRVFSEMNASKCFSSFPKYTKYRNYILLLRLHLLEQSSEQQQL